MSSNAGKRTVRYFVSYTRADDQDPDRLLKELENYHDYSPRYLFERWRDTAIAPGENWHAEIQAALDGCDFGLLLVSPAFLARNYITAHELPRFVSGDKPCIPVALRPLALGIGDHRGLEALQIFGLPLPRDPRPRSFQECTSAKHRTAFAHKLFERIVERLDKLFGVEVATVRLVASTSAGLDESAYRVHIRKHYRHLQLEALGGDTIYRDIDLQQVFIPQDARDCREWLPTTLEGPLGLTLTDTASDLHLAELHEHKRFRETAPRGILGLLDECAFPQRVVLGAPGAGKSSLIRIRLLAWAEAPDRNHLPILIEMRRFHRSGRTDFLDYLENDPDLVFHFRAADLRARLIAGSAELLFDGLDEIFEPAARETAARQIAAYAETFPSARLLVSSRLVGYLGRILRDADFSHWLIADFDDEKIAAFLDHWLSDAIRELGDRPGLRQRLDDALRSPVVRELAGNPLLLTLMAVLARKSDLPRDLASLYASAADLLLQQWDTHRLLAADVQLGNVLIDQKDKRDLLRDLAWKMQTGQRGLRGNLIGAEEVKAAMDAAFRHRIPDAGLRRKAINLLIEQLTERNYILCHVGGAQFAFVHRGFLEYFASEHLVRIITQRPESALAEIGEIYRAHAVDDAWREVLILAATRFEPSVADKILLPLFGGTHAKAVRNSVVHGQSHPFILACNVLARAREPQKLAATYLSVRGALEGWIRSDAERGNRHIYGYLLVVTLKDEATRKLLAEVARRYDDSSLRSQAIISLGEHFRDDITRELLVEVARRDDDTNARGQAVYSLAEHFGDDTTRALLIELARRDDDTGARVRAVNSLAERFLDDTTRNLLIELARSEGETGARSQAVDLLAQHFRDEATGALLVELAHRDEDTRPRRRAFAYLAEHFRDSPGIREELLSIASTPSGVEVIMCSFEVWSSVEAEAYLRGILKEVGAKFP